MSGCGSSSSCALPRRTWCTPSWTAAPRGTGRCSMRVWRPCGSCCRSSAARRRSRRTRDAAPRPTEASVMRMR
ncbi:hypothetical protein STCU_10825 [Strigomonas culicis]|uniref:Uncharacterized protein n=1 Tax=Strigomonas culicis TaxID=28005 RepID=S9V2R8_9TRYP|nr:hypothetical protein STCU_10825 [Strigomonas culicis]|eukprot:EPY17085.1 hypothetical protein STCU_10825 [Strigomonas culicis]